MAAEGKDFAGAALFDRNRGAVGTGEVDRGRRRGDVEGNAVLLRQDGERIGPDLVGGVAVGGDTVGADDDGRLAAGERRPPMLW
jgi:hypothetical protein